MPGKKVLVFMDISIGTRTGGRVVFELFADLTPRTVENFRGLCTGEYGVGKTTKKKLSYEGCSFFRSSKGFHVQSGDFQFNNGDGGESIYGGHFNDEDMGRRHTQAGILSMANKGRNSNGSQFFITLKRAPQLDARHVAFGQVVDGMDVIRAIARVPTDLDERPRVAVKIVGCGQVDRKVQNQADLHVVLGKEIQELQLADGEKVQEATKAKAILAGKPGGAKIDGDAAGGRGGQEDEEDKSAALAPPRNERERKLYELRLKMNACRTNNSKEVVEEQKRHADPNYAKKKAEERHKRALEQEEGHDKDGIEVGKGKKGQQQNDDLPEGKRYMADTIESAELREAKKKKGNPDAFGWDIFNQDSLLRAHEKRLKTIEFDEKAYVRQKEQLEDEGQSSMWAGHGHQASDAAKDRLQQAMDKSLEKSKAFSRRRAYCPDKDCDYINDRNMVFNQKMERYFNTYTAEIRQNLERGTAL